MAQEFIELWQEQSVLKKIIAAVGIVGFIAAALSSIFSLKETILPKEESAETQQAATENNGIVTIGNNNITNINSGNISGEKIILEEKKK